MTSWIWWDFSMPNAHKHLIPESVIPLTFIWPSSICPVLYLGTAGIVMKDRTALQNTTFCNVCPSLVERAFKLYARRVRRKLTTEKTVLSLLIQAPQLTDGETKSWREECPTRGQIYALINDSCMYCIYIYIFFFWKNVGISLVKKMNTVDFNKL